jgi:glutamine synthetase adenylyltransferase
MGRYGGGELGYGSDADVMFGNGDVDYSVNPNARLAEACFRSSSV